MKIAKKDYLKIAELKEMELIQNYCVVGVSGGRDYFFIILYKENFKPQPFLSVHYDNGFDSDTGSNILNICQKLNVDLETNVADWQILKRLLNLFLAFSDPDTPTDVGIFKTMYQTERKSF